MYYFGLKSNDMYITTVHLSVFSHSYPTSEERKSINCLAYVYFATFWNVPFFSPASNTNHLPKKVIVLVIS